MHNHLVTVVSKNCIAPTTSTLQTFYCVKVSLWINNRPQFARENMSCPISAAGPDARIKHAVDEKHHDEKLYPLFVGHIVAAYKSQEQTSAARPAAFSDTFIPFRCGASHTQPEGAFRCVSVNLLRRQKFPVNVPESEFIRDITVNYRVTEEKSLR